jgi:3-hydroxymyristoyl/3-hydroxydecanoyl-(acyl carrier protein) dehydratase
LTIVERLISFDHPAAQGHFPGNPIIPGAVLLSEVLRSIEAEIGKSLSPYRITSVKFFHPTRPGERLSIEFSGAVQNQIRFTCIVATKTVLAGAVMCDIASTLA